MIAPSQRTIMIYLLIFALLPTVFITREIEEDGWTCVYPHLDEFVGCIKDCGDHSGVDSACDCIIAVPIIEGKSKLRTTPRRAMSITNTWTIVDFMKQTHRLVATPANFFDAENARGIKLIPWYTCGLSVISVSSTTPNEVLKPFEDVLMSLGSGCYDMNTFDDEDFDHETSESAQLTCNEALFLLSFWYLIICLNR